MENTQKLNLMPDQKICITVEEAAEYSMIGENRLRKIIDEDSSLDWVLHVGSRVRIKRPQFEAWLSTQISI